MNPMTPHTPVEGLVAKWRDEAAKYRLIANVAQERGDLAGADESRDHASDIDGRANELEAALASLPVEGWVPISEAPETELLGEGLAALVYSPEFGVQIGRVYNFAGDKPRGFASGFNGDWNVTHFRPLPQPPQDQRQGNEQGGTHEL
jgi:hypothetical protein